MTVQAEHEVDWSWERPDVLPERLRVLRETFRLTPVTASKAVGFSDQTWRNYEAGQPVKGHVLMAIAMAFECDGDKARALKEWLENGGDLPEKPQPPESTLRLSRDLDGAGHEPYPGGTSRFSGADVGKLCAAARVSAA